MRRIAITVLLIALAACGPQIGPLERGETGRVVRAYAGDTLELDSGLRVFLAEVDAPRGEDAYAAQAQGELEALALHREVLLAYGGTRRWVPRPREGQTEVPDEAAIAHVFVKSEGGRWFWLQHEMVSRGAAFVRPRHDNHARSAELITLEARAREAERGLWGRREYRDRNAEQMKTEALAYGDNCLRGNAPYRFLEDQVSRSFVSDGRAALFFGPPGEGMQAVVFGESFAQWDGPPLSSLDGALVRLRGPIGAYGGVPQICLQHSSQLEVLPER